MSEDETRSEADFIATMLHVRPPASILDVPCGHGRLCVELGRRGFKLTGVDFSPAFLDEARIAASGRHLSITWEQREMRDLPWKSVFDGAFCFGNSFGYLDDEGNASFLKAIHRVLKPGARFVLDAASVAENILPRIQDHSEMNFGDILFLEENRYDHLTGRLETDYTFVRGSQVEKRFGSHRIYTFREVCRLLEEAGFTHGEAYGSVNLEPYRLGAQGLFLVAEKKS